MPLAPGNIQNAIIMGAPGCGKSVLLLTMLLYQQHLAGEEKKDPTDPMTFLVLDIKPELARKSTEIKNNPKVHVMNPQDRASWGWDAFYNLKPESCDDDLLSELDTIARALIDQGKNEKNAFFYNSAQNIMKGVMFYSFRHGMSFAQGLDYLMDGSLEEVLKKTLEEADEKPELKVVRKLLSPYAGKTGEAMEGIELSLREGLACYMSQSVKWFLDGNPRKASPLDLENKISVFFSIHETLVDEYRNLLRLVTMQIMRHCSCRSEDSHMLTLVIDEAARLGSINWTSFLATSRSRQCATILAFQSISQMQSVWGKDDAKSLIELCRVIAVLSCTDQDTAKMLSEWAGEYKEEKRSTNTGGKSSGTYSTSYDDKKILQLADIMSLQDKKEILLFIKGTYYRCAVDGARYYNIKPLNEISLACKAVNEEP